MAFKVFTRLSAVTLRLKSPPPAACSALSSGCGLTVEHDRRNRRFTVALPGSGAGKQEGPGEGAPVTGEIPEESPASSRGPLEELHLPKEEPAVLLYRFTGEKEVDLMSTCVPETFRGQGVAALLSQAAMDFLIEENLKAHVSCWYIKRYIEDNPLRSYNERVIA